MIPFVPIKWETSLNEVGLITDNKLIIKCWSKNTKRNNPESAITSFLPIDDFTKPELLISLRF